MSSPDKGKRGERLAAELLRSHGFEARRGQQYSGLEGDDLIHNVDGIHFEVKFRQALNPWDALQQASEDAGDRTPVVLWKRNRKPWLVVMDAGQFLTMRRKHDTA